jgi:hypothetical protein
MDVGSIFFKMRNMPVCLMEVKDTSWKMEKPGHVAALKNSPDSSGGLAGTNSRNIADGISYDALKKKHPL